MIPRPIGKNGWIDDFSTGAALPRIKSTNKIIILFGIHSSTAFGTFHSISPLSGIGFVPFRG